MRPGRRPGGWFGAVALCVGLASCSSSSEEPALTLRFEHRIEDEPLALGTTYATPYGQQVTFERLRYWVSKVRLHAGEDTHEVPSSYYLVEQTPERVRLQVEIPQVPPGSYDALSLHIGVDPERNGDPELTPGELGTVNGMEWGAGTGYKFFVAEGSFVEGETEGRFVVHTGRDALYKRLSAELPAPLDILEEGSADVVLRADLDRLFAGVELRKTPRIVGGRVDSTAGKVAGNYARMYSLMAGDEPVRMSGSSPNLQGGGGGDIPTDGTPPELTEPFIAFDEALFCDAVPSRPEDRERGCVTPFRLGEGTAASVGTLGFVTSNGAAVRAAAPGVVADVELIEHSDITHSDLFLVTVRPNEDSAFWLEYRSLKDLAVAEGDEVEAGQVLGGAGDYFDADVGRVFLGVRRQQELLQRLCPVRYATSEVQGALEQALETNNEAWPEHAHDAPCESTAVVCGAERCTEAADFAQAQGDVDGGRRIYRDSCASCHGDAGEGDIGPPLCSGPDCPCTDCSDHATLAERIESDMPPEGYCGPRCSTDVAAFILHELSVR